MGSLIRLAVLDDAKDILEIYTHYVLNTSVTFDINPPSLKKFRAKMKKILHTYPFFVAVRDKKIIGYAYAYKFKNMPCYDFSVESTIYLHPKEVGKGTGIKLYEALENALKMQGITNIYACITLGDDEFVDGKSVRFHEKIGFHRVGTFSKCAYKFDRWYDMVWLGKFLSSHDENKAKLVKFFKIKKA
ncbi:MAG: GNAT family N-acetyltransferase [Campylobacter sp.]|nr:GNAT family N-acetyltransferase [Campylobacter sp.]